MSWPLSQDYNEAIQSPATNFADSDLKRGEAVCNALGLPTPFSGNFADVYQVRCPEGSRWAVKCFTRQAPGLRERYLEISKHLRQAKLPFTVEFSYLDQGIRVAGKWYPVLKMQWVDGLTLNQFVAQHLDKPAMLEALLQMWVRMSQYLRAAGVAHSDLQHGNVLLVPGASANSLALKLIDYDGMWVPALAASKSGEVGHPSYQHPQRLSEGTYSPEVDRFPLLLVATALRALKVRKDLWTKYDNGDNILFKEADLLAPLKSHLFLDLTKTGDPAVGPMMDLLVKALRGRLETVPLLEDVLGEGRPALATPVALPNRPAPTVVRKAASVAPRIPTAAAVGAGALIFDEPQPGVNRPPRKRVARKSRAAAIGGWIAAIAAIGLGAGIAVWAVNNGLANPIKPAPPEARVAQNETEHTRQDPKPDLAPSKDKDKGPAPDAKPDPTPIKDIDKTPTPDPRPDLTPVRDQDKGPTPTPDPKPVPTPPLITDKDKPAPKDQPGHVGNPPDVKPPNPADPRPEDDFVNTIGMKFKRIKAGTFKMGSPFTGDPIREKLEKLERPEHEVELSRPFYLGATTVTKGQFVEFVKEEAGYKTEAELSNEKEFTWQKPGFDQTDDDPVVYVSWNDAVKFCDWLSKKEQKKYQLPTEAQWEYACRADTKTAYFFGDDPKELADYAWDRENSGGRTHPVGGKKPNPWGLYDMNGNVQQWCADAYSPYPSGYVKDPDNANSKADHALRGGSWASPAKDCRSACRRAWAPTSRDHDVGFRVQLVVE